MDRRSETSKPRGRITAPTRRSAANSDDSLTIDDIPNVLHHTGRTQEKIHLRAPKQPLGHAIPPVVTRTAPSHTPTIRTLAGQRAALGFDDIPVAAPGEIEREKAKNGRIRRILKNKKLQNWKEDLQWAIKADKGLDETTDKPRRRTVKPAETTKTIDINISFGDLPKLPKIARPKNPFQNIPRFTWTHHKKRVVIGTLVVIGVLAVLYSLPVTQQLLPSSKNEGPALSAASTPSYQTVLPAGKTDITWQRVSPPDRDPVFAYGDTLENVKIAVSQQPIPDNFKPNVADSVANLAKSYAATDKVTAGDTQLYVGTSGQGPQSVIFTKNGLLVLIKSSSKIPDAAWARYIESLQNGPHY